MKQVFVLSGVLVTTDKFIDEKYADNIRRFLSMTKVARLYEEEKQEAVNLAEQKRNIHVAESLIKDEVDTVVIMRATGFSREQIEELRNNILITK